MANNAFDQFDMPEANEFDQFDAPVAQQDAFAGIKADIAANQPETTSTTYKAANKASLPNVWNAKLGDVTVKAYHDPQAGGYIFPDAYEQGKFRMVVRKPDGTLDSKPYQFANPTEGMSKWQQFAAGMGKTLTGMARGVNQLATFDPEKVEAQRQEEILIRERDKHLSDTGAGFGGETVGGVAGALLPGAALKAAGTVAKAAGAARAGQVANAAGNAVIAPRTLKGAAALGAGLGVSAPATSTSERAMNTGSGAGAGAALPVAMTATGAAVRAVAPKVASTTSQAVKGAAGAARSIAEKTPILSRTSLAQQPAIVREVPKMTQAQADQAARDATRAMGFDWSALADSDRAAIVSQVKESTNLEAGITPEGIVKKVMLEKLGFKPTRAMLTGRAEDYSAENSARLYPEGADLLEIDRINNANLKKQIQETAPGDAVPVQEFGADLRKGLGADKAVTENRTGNLYSAAAEQEGHITTDASELIAALNNKQSFAVSKQDSPVREFLRRIGKDELFFPSSNTVKAKNQPKELTMSELATLRQIVNSKWENADNATQASLNRLRAILNDMEANPNEPAPLYQKARISRIVQGKKWESPQLDDIFEQHPQYKGQMQVADENLFKHTFVTPTVDKTRTVWARMNAPQKQAARQQMAKFIEDEVFSNMGMGTGVNREVIGSAAKLIRTLNKIGDQKLSLILGKEQAGKLRDLSLAWRDIQSSPPGTKAAGSAPELAMMKRGILAALKGLQMALPYGKGAVGNLARKTEQAAKKDAEAQVRQQAVRSALDPLGNARANAPKPKVESRRGALTIPSYSVLQGQN